MLRSYLVDALKDGPSNDGLIQRFQLLVWPDTPAEWNYIDRIPSAANEEVASRVFRRLVTLDAENPLRFRFNPDAQQLFVEWLADLESKIRGGELHAALVCHLSKYRSLMPSLALLFELADRAAGGFEGFVGANPGEWQNFWVSLEHAQQAGAWCEYLESHARRVYSCVTTPRMRAARELADKIKQRKVGANGSFTCRDVYLKGWSGLDEPETVKVALEVLLDADWVRELGGEPNPSGGRPSARYAVNPRVWR
jgi:putative DNA primase/helicase